VPTVEQWTRDFLAFAEDWKSKPPDWLPREEYIGDNPFHHFVLTEEAESWADFIHWADEFSDRQWCFRGQREASWPLQTSLDRRFQQDAHNYLTHVPTVDDISSWHALMQHFNAPTPLMDWTKSPFVAAYLALDDQATDRRPAEDDPHSTVWAIDLNWLGEKREQLFKAITDSSELLRNSAPTVVRINPPMSNPRLFAQQGVFLAKLYDEASFGQLLMTMMLRPDVTDKPVIRRIEIGNTIRIPFLKRLRSINIHRASLFPGLDGLGALLKHDLELTKSGGSYHTRFLPGHEPEVLTSVSDECSVEDCAACRGILRRVEHGDKPIFCIHDCHKVKNQAECPACGKMTSDRKAGAFDSLIPGRVTCSYCGHEFTTRTKPEKR
jgi:hypothetical protein